MSGGVLVAGIGNIFLSDDGFGVEVANRLNGRLGLNGQFGLDGRAGQPGVRVVDFGIRGVHLAYELLDGYDGLILVDAVAMGESPGTVAVIQPGPEGLVGSGAEALDAHSMSPDVVLATLSRLGGTVEQIFVVGCQPANLDEGIGLSPPVAAAVDGAVDLCCQLVAELVESAGKGAEQ
jgi:hydrogenase maturation protease